MFEVRYKCFGAGFLCKSHVPVFSDSCVATGFLRLNAYIIASDSYIGSDNVKWSMVKG